MNEDTLGDRMKAYEAEALANDKCLDKYVVLRLDGSHFHSWTRAMKMARPFDVRMTLAMQHATLDLCNGINTCIMGYCQSDEITLVLKKGEKVHSEPWFMNRVQKLCSISASICSVAFNLAIAEHMEYRKDMRAYFDSRVVFLPSLDEVVNNLIWRQNDCIKNSVSVLAQSLYSPKQLLHKDQAEQLEMIRQAGRDWNELAWPHRLGTLVHKVKTKGTYLGHEFYRGAFFVDDKPPRFSEDKQFLLDAYNFTLEEEDGGQEEQ